MGCTLKMTFIVMVLLLLADTTMAVKNKSCSSDADCREGQYCGENWHTGVGIPHYASECVDDPWADDDYCIMEEDCVDGQWCSESNKCIDDV